MTDSLYVTLAPAPRDPAVLDDYLARCRVAVASAVAPSAAARLRLVARRDGVLTIEPFVGASSLRALLGIPRKRADGNAIVRVLVECAFPSAHDVGLLAMREGDARPPRRTELALSELDPDRRWTEAVWYRLRATRAP